MKQKLIWWCVLFLSGFLFAQDSTGVKTESAIKLSSSVDKTTVPLNRTVTYTIRLQWSGDLDRYEIHKFDNPILQNFKIVGNASSNRVLQERGKKQAITEYEYELKPTNLGMGYIEGIIIKYTDLETDRNYRLVSNRMEVKVEEPLPEPGSTRWLWVLLLFVVVAVLVSVYVLVKRRQQKLQQRKQQQAENSIPTEQKLLDQLKQMDLNDADLDMALAYTTITRLLKRYLAEKGVIPGVELTTGEIVEYLNNQETDTDFIDTIDEILKTADLHKFSGSAGDKHQIDRIYTLFEKMLQENMSNRVSKPDLGG